MNQYHTHNLKPTQCGSTIIRKIDAPLALVWSMVRQFDDPQVYKAFIKSCILKHGNGADVGSVREVKIISGLPAETSIERLDKLDDDLHVMMFSIIGGDHRLKNYQATTTVHDEAMEDEEYSSCTVVIESYVVDVPDGSSVEDTCSFVNTIVECNLRSLATIAEKMG